MPQYKTDQKLYHAIRSVLLCLDCGEEKSDFTETVDAMTCTNCGYSYPIIKKVLSAFHKKKKDLIHYSEIPSEERESFIKRKAFAYEGEGIISTLFNHYHVFAAKQRHLFRPQGFFFDLGCGIGEHSSFLSNEEANKYIGLDLDRYKLEVFRASHPETLLIQCDARHLPFKSSCTNFLQTTSFLEHFDTLDLLDILNEIKRLLKPGSMYVNCMPAEGSLFLTLSRWAMNLVRLYSIGVKVDLQHDHKSEVREIQKTLARIFKLQHSSYFPIKIPSVQTNLFINQVYTLS